MSLLSENVIHGNHGKIFETNATEHNDVLAIAEAISKLKGIKDVIVNESHFPKQLTVHTSSIVSVKAIEDVVIKKGFHAIPKSVFEL